MAKKKKSKKKDNKLSFNAEYHNLVTIFVGIFLLYSLNSNSMGLIGSVMQTLFKGLFGSLSIVIPFIVILSGILGFFEGNEYIYRLKNTKIYYAIILFMFVFYGLLNALRELKVIAAQRFTIAISSLNFEWQQYADTNRCVKTMQNGVLRFCAHRRVSWVNVYDVT